MTKPMNDSETPRNQCDGCMRGLPVNSHGHHAEQSGEIFSCTKDRYETKGPREIHVLDGKVVHKSRLTEKGFLEAVVYVPENLYTQSQRELEEVKADRDLWKNFAEKRLDELEQAKRELAEVKRERDEAHDKIIRMANEHFQETRRVYGAAIERGRQENKEERDRYREALYQIYWTCGDDMISKEGEIAFKALNPPTPKPDDAVTREGG